MNKKINDCKTLDELFDMWKKAQEVEENWEFTTLTNHTKSIEKNSFNKDGYINKNEYEKSKLKVLFILKETNILDYKREDDIPSQREQINFYNDFIKCEKQNQPKMQEKIARMAYYLQHKNENKNKKVIHCTLNEAKEALKKSAFMNMNKRGGGKHVTDKYYNYVEKYKEYILKQIQILNPDYIVVLGADSKNKVLNEIKNRYSQTIIMWHTSYRMSNCVRNNNCTIDKNVDCYLNEFIKRVEKL